MKKLLVLAAIAVFSFTSVNAQDGVDKVIDQAKNGGFKVGANIGLPLSTAGDLASFNIGFDIAYLFEVMENLEVGGLVAYTHFFGDGVYTYEFDDVIFIGDYEDTSFVPIATSARYYFAERKFFGGLDLGYAINVSGEADGGFYYRPKFGFNLGMIALIASYQGISGGVNYNTSGPTDIVTGSGFNSFNVGAEYSF